jgi:unspecific monooxygenase
MTVSAKASVRRAQDVVPQIKGAPFPPAAFEQDVIVSRFLGRQLMIVSRPAAARRILVENAANYVRPFVAHRVLGPPIGGGLFLAEGEEWRRQRKLLAPDFAPRSVPAFASHALRHAREFAARFEGVRKPVDLLAPLQALTLAITAEALFDIEIGVEDDTVRALARSYTKRLARPTMLDFLLPPWLPSPRDVPRRLFQRRWLRMISQMIAERRNKRDAKPGLFELLRDSEAGRGLFEAQVATMLVTGSETTGVGLFWTMYLIATHPAIQDRLALEAADVLNGNEDAAACVSKLVYTKAVVQEALRLYPPGFSIVRQALEDDVADGVPIPKNATVETSPWVMHHHRRLWLDPDTFDPLRFLGGSDQYERGTYLPFGLGPRKCIGEQFALAEIVLAVATVVQRFSLALEGDWRVRLVARITLQPDSPPRFRLSPR